MRRIIFVLGLFTTLLLGMSSCAVSDAPGFIYMGHTKPMMVTSNPVGMKVGTVKTMNIFNVVTLGNASVARAAKMAGITKISHVDVKTTGVLTLFCVKTYYVYGE